MLTWPKKKPLSVGKVTTAVFEFGTVFVFQLPGVFHDSLAVTPVQVWAAAQQLSTSDRYTLIANWVIERRILWSCLVRFGHPSTPRDKAKRLRSAQFRSCPG